MLIYTKIFLNHATGFWKFCLSILVIQFEALLGTVQNSVLGIHTSLKKINYIQRVLINTEGFPVTLYTDFEEIKNKDYCHFLHLMLKKLLENTRDSQKTTWITQHKPELSQGFDMIIM